MTSRPPTTTNTTTSRSVRDTRKLPVLGSDDPDAITLGRHLPSKRKMRYGGDQHVLVFGPNGKGKGTRILMPNLLEMSGRSIVVVDPKGELAAVTAKFRRTLGRVVIINPFGVLTDIPGYADLKSEGFNPLARLNPTADSFNAEASLLAAALISDEGVREPHWPQSARALVAALIMFAVIEKREPSVGDGFRDLEPAPGEKDRRAPLGTLCRVRELLTLASAEGNAGNNYKPRGIPALAERIMDSTLPGLRNKAAQFTDWNHEIQGIASTAKIQTEPFDDPQIARDLAMNGVDFRDLKKQPTTVYLILPPEMMGRHSKWLRLLLTSAIQSVMRVRRPGEPKVLFMLDEFFALGHLEIISTVWALVRGYGIQIMPILQDLPQLKKLYPKMWQTFVGMAGAVASFAPNDMETAEWLSKRMGETTTTIMNYSTGTTTNDQGETTSNTSSSYSSVKAPLVLPHQLFGLREGHMVVTLDGLSDAVLVDAKGYYQIRQCDERARDNPYYQG